MSKNKNFNFKKPNSVENIVLNFNKKKGAKRLLIVDQQKGPFKRIQDALDNAVSNSRIKIESGIYRENLIIKTENIFLEKKRKESEVYILGLNGPTIIIDLENKGTVNIQGLNITNNGYKKIKFNENHLIIKKQKIYKSFELTTNYLSKLESDFEKENLIFLNRGILFLTNCKLNLNLYFKTSKGYTSSIYTKSNSKLVIDKCMFEGSKIFETHGIICNNSDISIKNSSLKNHLGCGLLLNLSKKNLCSIYLCKFSLNTIGLMTFGENCKSKITDCTLEKNQIGIYISLANDILLTKTKIINNEIGICVLNADSNILDNLIEHNQKYGIFTNSDDGMITKSLIKNNIIRFNNRNGIKCSGYRNYSIIKNNSIYYNKKSGIYTTKSSHIIICKNLIYNNISQGITIKDSSSAFVQENKIYDNLKANIAIGGSADQETTILKNDIYDGRCEGIFLLQNFKTFIFMNNIYHNYNGILCINSSPVCFGNKIYKNKSHGFNSLKKSNINLRENHIFDNFKIGTFFRGSFIGEVIDNEVYNNKIDLVIESKSNYPENIVENNNYKGEKRYSKISFCRIF